MSPTCRVRASRRVMAKYGPSSAGAERSAKCTASVTGFEGSIGAGGIEVERVLTTSADRWLDR